MVEAQNYTWDGALLSRSSHLSLVDLGYLAPIMNSGGPGPNLATLPQEFYGDFIMGVDIYATVLAYRTDALGDNPPKNWADFFDLENFQGARALRKNPFDTVEQALLADGVAPADIYPLDFDRAFAKLDQIKSGIDTWWTNGAQTSQLLASGEIDMLPAWNGRAQVAIDGGAPVKLVWDNAFYTYEGWTILKGSPNEELMREFIDFCAQPDRQAEYTPFVAYGPTNPKAFDFIDAARAEILPSNPAYLPKMIAVDSVFWGKNKDAVTERFEAWLLA
ncbi:extracellular solute-binding protein [Ochrobactrum grignonense]|nr:extracellular solute-binding protein [Brucella grignonensis]